MKMIMYRDPSTGSLVFLAPAQNCGLSLQQIAAKDVPAGKPFTFVDFDDVPPTLAEREAKFSGPQRVDGLGADYGAGSENVVIAWTKSGRPVTKRVTKED